MNESEIETKKATVPAWYLQVEDSKFYLLHNKKGEVYSTAYDHTSYAADAACRSPFYGSMIVGGRVLKAFLRDGLYTEYRWVEEEQA